MNQPFCSIGGCKNPPSKHSGMCRTCQSDPRIKHIVKANALLNKEDLLSKAEAKVDSYVKWLETQLIDTKKELDEWEGNDVDSELITRAREKFGLPPRFYTTIFTDREGIPFEQFMITPSQIGQFANNHISTYSMSTTIGRR